MFDVRPDIDRPDINERKIELEVEEVILSKEGIFRRVFRVKYT